MFLLPKGKSNCVYIFLPLVAEPVFHRANLLHWLCFVFLFKTKRSVINKAQNFVFPLRDHFITTETQKSTHRAQTC